MKVTQHIFVFRQLLGDASDATKNAYVNITFLALILSGWLNFTSLKETQIENRALKVIPSQEFNCPSNCSRRILLMRRSDWSQPGGGRSQATLIVVRGGIDVWVQ